MPNKKLAWFKFWSEQWLGGTTRWELSPLERSVFVDFLCLAARPHKGPTGQFSIESITILSTTLNYRRLQLESTVRKLIDTEKIQVNDLNSGKCKQIVIVNWADYQRSLDTPKTEDSTLDTPNPHRLDKRRKEEEKIREESPKICLSAIGKEMKGPTEAEQRAKAKQDIETLRARGDITTT